MDYLKIVLKGISDENSNSYLIEYFKREFKNAKKKNYKPIEFFNGLKSIIRSFENDLQSQLNKRKTEIEFMLNQAKNKTVKFNEKDQPDLTYEEKCDFLVKNCKSELNDLSKNNFYFTINNKIIENKSISGQLSYSEIKRIDKSIFIAEKEIQLKKFQKQVSKIKTNTVQAQKKPKQLNSNHPAYDPNLWNSDCYYLFKYLYDNYYNEGKTTNRKLTNIWFYLKESNNPKYVLKATKKEYIKFIKDKYKNDITNFDKAETKYNEKVYPTLNDHRINFDSNAKHVKNT